MDIEARDCGKEGDPLFAAHLGIFQAVMMQYPVVDPLRRCAFLHLQLEVITAPRDSGKEAQIPFWLGIDDPAVWGRRAAATGVTGLTLAAHTRTPPFDTAAVRAISPANHFMSTGADGDTVFIEPETFGVYCISGILLIQSDDRIDVPRIEQLICSIIVAGAVRNKGVDSQVWIQVTQLRQRDNSSYTVMAFRVNNAQIEW